MKDLLRKIKAVRAEVILGKDSRKTGAGGTWEYVSMGALFNELNPILDKHNVEVLFNINSDDKGDFVEVQIIDLEGNGELKNKAYISQNNKQGVQGQIVAEAERSYLKRVLTISTLRLNVLTVQEAEYKRAMATQSKEREELIKKIDKVSTPNQKKWVRAKYDLDNEDIDTLKGIIKLLEGKNAKSK